MKQRGVKKWGIIDLLGFGVFVLMLLTAVFFFLRRSVYINVVLRVAQNDSLQTYYSLPMWYLENLKPGMEQKDLLGRPVISIVKNFSYSSNSSDKVVYLTLKLLTTFDKKSGIYSYEGVPLLVGSYQNLKIKGISIRGVVHRIENKDYKPEKKMYLIEGYINPAIVENQDPYTAETMTDGVQNYLADKVVKGLKILDSDGTVIAEILEVRKEVAYRKFIYNNQLVEVPDNERKKVRLKAKIETERYGDVFLFRNEMSLKINHNVYLSFSDFDLPVTITDVSEI